MGHRNNRVLCVALFVALAACIAVWGTPAHGASSHVKKLPCGPSKFLFYLHNTVYNPVVNNTNYFNSIYGRAPNISFPNPFSFGVMNTFEDPLTAGPSNTSKSLGKAQGFYVLNSFTEFTLFHLFTANITEGDFKGTIDIFGQVREVDPVRYLTVIGGTGAFLGARGLASCTLVDIDHGQGISGLWAGTTPAVVRVGLGAGLYFSMLNPILAFLSAGDLTASSSTTENLQKRLPHSVVLAAGAITRSAAAAIVCPVTVLKTRMEYEAVSGVHYPNPLRSLALIGRTEGLKGLYSGLLPTILRDAPYSGLYLLLYSSTRRAISEWQNLSGAHMQVNFIAGAVAGASATVLTHPPDVVRTKLQLESGQHSGIISSVRHVYQCNGIRGFFAGIVPRAGRRALHQAISWTVYEELMRRSQRSYQN